MAEIVQRRARTASSTPDRVATISPTRKPYTPPAWPEPPRSLAPIKRDDDGPTLHCPHYSGMDVINQ